MKKSMIIRVAIALFVCIAAVISVLTALTLSSSADDNIFNGTKQLTFEKTEAVERLMATSQHYIVVKQKQMGGSHYAYTEAVTETNNGVDYYAEYNFDPGAELVALSVLDNGDGTVSTYEKSLLKLTAGVVRDPSVSVDGTKVVYSKKLAATDDYHIYEMELTSGDFKEKQLTFGSGRADIEPQYLANGDIVFSSTRDVQTVDCWYTPVSNLYIMNGDGSNIRRVGYDQVHTTFPTATSDGRILYTRWDYNDRTQMYVQGVFQMMQDGSGQTEVWGNNADFPTTLLHTREIPGAPGKYISIASGHHVQQKGKLVIVDTTAGRNSEDAIKFLFPDSTTAVKYHYDLFGQNGRAYKYPYAIDENTILVSSCDNYTGKNAVYNIYLCDTSKGFANAIVLCEGTAKMPAAQIVPIKTTDAFDRYSTVDYAQSTGTYYVSNVYEGDSMKGVAQGSVKYLRVVALDFRSSSMGATISSGGSAGGTADIYSPIATGNGSWDVKNVLGIVPVEEDGSALFTVPCNTPLYFQLLDKDGCMIQTMRSWSTLTPGETFSCVGCHENKNTAPVSGGGVTMAMKKGVQELQKDLWMEGCPEYEDFDPYTAGVGFSYNQVIQPILDSSCIICHSDYESALKIIDGYKAGADTAIDELGYNIHSSALWCYSVDGGTERSAYAPFGDPAAQTDVNTRWSSGKLTIKNSFVFTQYNKEACSTDLRLTFSGNVTVKINGETVYTDSSVAVVNKNIVLNKAVTDKFILGTNEIEITVEGGTHYIDCAIKSYVETALMTLVSKNSTWKYYMSSSASVSAGWNEENFNDSSWNSGKAPFGDRGDVTPMNTSWAGSNSYIWLRQKFELTADQIQAMKGGAMSMNIFYDDSMVIYINGKQFYRSDKYNDSYEIIDVSGDPESVFKAGTNVIAISLHNTAGGRAIDLALRVTPKTTVTVSSDAKFALTGDMFYKDNNRMMRAMPLSYFVLTGSYPSGSNWVGRASGTYVKWISSMSGAEKLTPYYSGSTKSPLITKLRSGHGSLTEEQIRAIECWIDLAVPCFGSYDEGEMFNANARRVFEERENKRNFYDQWDIYSKMDLGGVLPVGTLEVNFKSKDGKQNITQTGDGYVIINIPQKYAVGDTVTVKVTGSKYIAVSVSERQGESILYVPNGEFTYTIPATAANTSCTTFYRASGASPYRYNTLFVRIPREEELKTERNLAVNTYDGDAQQNAFPHVSGKSATDEKGTSAVYNAVDGFSVNGGSGAWPYQSYVPAGNEGMKIDFGREVVVNTLMIRFRAAAGDAHLMSAVVTFSDGSEQIIALCATSDFLTFDLGGKTVTDLTIGGFDKAGDGAFGLTEVRVIGYDA